MRTSLFALGAVALAAAAGTFGSRREGTGLASETTYDPLAALHAAGAGAGANREANIPPQCYASTAGGANTCWTCHTIPLVATNLLRDFDLQSEYTFSDSAKTSYWTNLFATHGDVTSRISDDEILEYIRQDNYAPLRRALAGRDDYAGFVPDVDLARGFDDEGFARDGSGWRAVRYKPFPGMGWPTNGNAGDVFIRLPAAYRTTADGRPSRAVYEANLAIVEAAIAGDPTVSAAALVRVVEPIDEVAVGLDVDGDGELTHAARAIRGLPATYVGAARDVAVRRFVYPTHVEFLHSVRYLDPESPTLLAPRMKELRYARKTRELGDWAIGAAYEHEANEKDEGKLPVYTGDPTIGLESGFGWRLQGFIEDAQGRLRAQTDGEHRFCMGCHSNVGVTVDQTFSFARKVPGAEGFRMQDLRGMKDVPQLGHEDPEVLTYLRRAGRGDDFGGNAELTSRFLHGGTLDERELRRGAPGGDRDLAYLVTPSRARALALDKAYLAVVRAQSFERGRDAVPTPTPLALRRISTATTGLDEAKTYRDGRLHLAW